MPRLFVAVDLPAVATRELARVQPAPMAGIRAARQDQMHLTLHFIGEPDVERIVAALSAAAVPAFSLMIEGVGQFCSAGGSVTLWARVCENAELLGLRAVVAAALAGEGFRPEARRYTPHITLARCGPAVPVGVVDEFLLRHKESSLPDVSVEGFSLYSSAFAGDDPVYQRERSFPLRGDGGRT